MNWGELVTTPGSDSVRPATQGEWTRTVALRLGGSEDGRWTDELGRDVYVLGGPDQQATLDTLREYGPLALQR